METRGVRKLRSGDLDPLVPVLDDSVRRIYKRAIHIEENPIEGHRLSWSSKEGFGHLFGLHDAAIVLGQ